MPTVDLANKAGIGLAAGAAIGVAAGALNRGKKAKAVREHETVTVDDLEKGA